jgi:diguanylate cyclase (GGDEF)-like protein
MVGGALVACYPLIPTGVAQDALYVTLGLSCVAAIVVGVKRHRPRLSAPWFLLGAGQLVWVVGDAVDSWHLDISHSAAFPSVVDVFYLLAYPVLAAGLLLMIRGRQRYRDFAGILDSAVVTAGLGLLSWVLLAGPTIAASDHSFLAAAVGVAYPVADILLIGALVRLLTTAGGRTPSLWLLLTGAALLVAGDSTSTALGLYTSSGTSIFDLIWLTSYVVWGAAALHPSMAVAAGPPQACDLHFGPLRVAALAGATLIAPATLAVQHLMGVQLDVWPIVVGMVVVMSVAIVEIVAANKVRDSLRHELAHEASHDSLTQLPNRAEALRTIEHALQRGQRHGTMTGLLFIDLDRFKAVDDNFGHRAGDDVLRVVAERLQTNVRGGDVVARLGGDEFVVILESVPSEADVVTLGHRLVTEVSAPIMTGQGHQVQVGASVGVAISQDGLVEPDKVLHEADSASYRAKTAGRGRVEVFDHGVRQELIDNAAQETAVRHALAHQELLLRYQPILDLTAGRVSGFHAVLYWNRPGAGMVASKSFLTPATTSELIGDTQRWVLAHALQQLARWDATDSSGRPVTMTVPIQSRHLTSSRMVADVMSAVLDSGIAPSTLILQVHDSDLLDEMIGQTHLQALRDQGVGIAVEDPGTHGPTVSRLDHLPVDLVATSADLSDEANSNDKVLQVLLHAAHTFDLPVTVTGITSGAQLNLLRERGCNYGQGPHIGQPMDPTDAVAMLGKPPAFFGTWLLR